MCHVASDNLEPGHSCQVSFEVSGDSGDGSIEVTYKGGSHADEKVTIPVSWYKPIVGVGQFSVEPENDPIVLSGVGPDFKADTKVTVTNIGLGEIKDVKVNPQTFGGGATIKAEGSNDCKDLKIDGSCDFNYMATDTTSDDAGKFTFTATGNDAEGKQGVTPVTSTVAYNVQAITGTLELTANVKNLSIVGNDQDSKTATITFRNTSNQNMPTINEQIDKSRLNGIKVETASNNCANKALEAGKECTETLILSPQTLAAGSNGLSGEISYTAIDSDGEQKVTIDLAVQPEDSYLVLDSVAADNAADGDGLANAPYDFKAGMGGQKSVTLTYKNEGKNPLVIKGINPPVDLDKAWEIDSENSDCYVSGENDEYQAKVLGGGETCTIQFNNQLYKYGDSQGSTNLDIHLPEMEVANNKGTTNTRVVPSNDKYKVDNTIHVVNHQATIVDTMETNEDGKTVNISHTISNFENSGYETLTEKSSVTNGLFLLVGDAKSQLADGCGLASDSTQNTVKEECTYTADKTSFINTYAINLNDPQVIHGTAKLNMTSKVFGGVNDAFQHGWVWFGASGGLTNGINQGQLRTDINVETDADEDENSSLTMFVTKGVYSGDLLTEGKKIDPNVTTGFEGADALCNAEASSSGDYRINQHKYKAFLVGNNAFSAGRMYTNADGEELGTATGPDYADYVNNDGMSFIALTLSDGEKFTFSIEEALNFANVNARMAWTGWNPNMKAGADAGGYTSSFPMSKTIMETVNENADTLLAGEAGEALNCANFTSSKGTAVAGSAGTPIDLETKGLLSAPWGDGTQDHPERGAASMVWTTYTGDTFDDWSKNSWNGGKDQNLPAALSISPHNTGAVKGRTIGQNYIVNPFYRARVYRSGLKIKGDFPLFYQPEGASEIIDTAGDSFTSVENSKVYTAHGEYGILNYQTLPSRFGDYAAQCGAKLHLYCVAQPHKKN